MTEMTHDSRPPFYLVGLDMHVLRAVVRKVESWIILCHSFIFLYICYHTKGVKIVLHEYGHDASIR